MINVMMDDRQGMKGPLLSAEFFDRWRDLNLSNSIYISFSGSGTPEYASIDSFSLSFSAIQPPSYHLLRTLLPTPFSLCFQSQSVRATNNKTQFLMTYGGIGGRRRKTGGVLGFYHLIDTLTNPCLRFFSPLSLLCVCFPPNSAVYFPLISSQIIIEKSGGELF